ARALPCAHGAVACDLARRRRHRDVGRAAGCAHASAPHFPRSWSALSIAAKRSSNGPHLANTGGRRRRAGDSSTITIPTGWLSALTAATVRAATGDCPASITTTSTLSRLIISA